MREKLMWTAIAVLTVIYVGVVGYALASSQADTSALLWILVMVPSVFAAGVVILWKRPDHRIGRLLTLAAITMFVIPTILEVVTVVRFEMGGEEPWMWAPMWLTTTLSAVGTVLLCAILVTIPDGEYRHNRERLLIRWSWLLVILPTLSLISNPFVVTFDQVYIGMDEIDSPYVIEPLESLGPLILDVTSLAFVLVFLAAVWFQILRYRQAATRERKQVRWVLFGGGMALLLGLIPFALGALGVTPTLTHGMVANAVFSAIPIILIPASIVVCVLEPKWVDVDIVIRRSFVYGALSFVILLLYVGVAAALGLAAGANLQIEIAIFLTVLVAILFQPARRWLQQLADRWVFGERPSKYEAVTEFGASLDEHSDPAELLPRLSDTLQRTLDVTWIEIVVEEGKAAAAGDSRGEPALVAPITDGVEELGEIRCGPKREGSFDDEEERLVHTLAGQIGLALSNARLAARLVNATEAERRRIERNIHDGAQQELVALVGQLGMAKSRAGNGGVTPDELAQLQAEAQRILRDLRELAQGIHPSVLTDGGVLEAVEERCSHLPIDITIEASPGLRNERFADDVEGASYFFVTESLANVLKHSEASAAVVSIDRSNSTLAIAVSDNGHGFDQVRLAGSGLAGLRDRISALGGRMRVTSGPDGTRVEATMPVR